MISFGIDKSPNYLGLLSIHHKTFNQVHEKCCLRSPRHIEDCIVRRQRLYGHPLVQAVVFGVEADPAVELTFHFYGLFAQSIQHFIGQVLPVLAERVCESSEKTFE